MSEILVMGISGEGPDKAQLTVLKDYDLIVTTTRFKAALEQLQSQLINISPLKKCYQAIEENIATKSIAVLASGDPLFFGIGRSLTSRFPEQSYRFVPAPSAVQLAAARFGIPWDDAHIVSLHGRDINHPAGKLLRHQKTIVFTDGKNSPDKIAAQLLDYLKLLKQDQLINGIRVSVASDLSCSTEELFEGSLAECSDRTFSSLNIMILQVVSDCLPNTIFGLREEEIVHSRGLITKNEVRAATLHQLRLPETGVFWDLGGGSGSISLEAACLCPDLTIYTVERNEQEIENIIKNIVKFNRYNIVPVHGRCPEILDELPDPSVVFIGGSGGQLSNIIKRTAPRLSENGCIVVNGVIARTVESAPPLLREAGFDVSTTTIEVHRSDANGHSMQFNPITIMAGRR